MAKTIKNPEYWLISLTFLLFFSLMAFRNTYTQCKKRPENKVLFEMGKKRIKVSMWMLSFLLCILILIILLGNTFSQLYWVGIFLAVLVEVAFMFSAVSHWNKTTVFVDGKK